MSTFLQFDLQGYQLDNAKVIGEGAYGKIYKVRSQKLGKDVAVKQICIKKIHQENQMESLYREIEIMKKLKNPHILELIQYSVKNNFAYFINELCASDLRKQLLKKKGGFPEQESIQIFAQVVKGMKILIDNSYVHRDLKPQNILIKDGVYKLTDFGYAKKADFKYIKKLYDICGTPIYMAPQLLHNVPYTAKCDIWSLGLILFEMIYGTTPWPVKCIENYKSALKKRPLAFPFNVKIGKQTKDFLKKALTIDDQKRMSWKQLYDHPLIKNKMAGEQVILAAPNFKVRRILSDMQRQAKRKFIDIIEVFENFADLKELNFGQFSKLLRQLNPTISTHEIKLIFQACDKNNNNKIEKKQFRQMFCNVNYHEHYEIEKEIDEIIGIICAKQVEVKDLFERFDLNKSGSLSLAQFENMIKNLAPAYGKEFIEIVFKIIDQNKDGLITKREFLSQIGSGLVNQKHYVGIWVQKVGRNIKALKSHLLERNLDTIQIVKLVDVNKDESLDIKQFSRLMQLINFNINSQQILDIFRVLDNDCSGKISMKQLKDYIGQ